MKPEQVRHRQYLSYVELCKLIYVQRKYDCTVIQSLRDIGLIHFATLFQPSLLNLRHPCSNTKPMISRFQSVRIPHNFD